MKNYEPVDPIYEDYVDSKGKTRRRKRELPPGLSARDAKVLRKVKSRAHRLDKGFKICGMRFGWTAVIGIVPVIGDFADIGVNYLLVVRKARQADIPPWLVRKMLINNAVSAGIGFVPLVGDVLLAMFKTNSRNATLLEEYLRIRGAEYLKTPSQRNTEEVQLDNTNTGIGSSDPSGSRAGRIMQNIRKGKPVADVEREKA